ILANKQVQPPVVVVIEPGSARAPPRRSHPRFRRNIGKCTIAIVVIQDAARVLRDVEIRKSIAVVIAYSNTHAIRVSRHTGLGGHVGESAVPVVVVKGIAQRLFRGEKVALPAVDQIDIHPAVVVVVDESAAGTHGFRLIHVGGKTRYMGPRDTAARGRNLLEGGWSIRTRGFRGIALTKERRRNDAAQDARCERTEKSAARNRIPLLFISLRHGPNSP